jgi:hypothetical protein
MFLLCWKSRFSHYVPNQPVQWAVLKSGLNVSVRNTKPYSDSRSIMIMWCICASVEYDDSVQISILEPQCIPGWSCLDILPNYHRHNPTKAWYSLWQSMWTLFSFIFLLMMIESILRSHIDVFLCEQLLTYLYISHVLPFIVIVCPQRFYYVFSNHNVESMSWFKSLTT